MIPFEALCRKYSILNDFLMMMLYPEEPFWGVPTIPGLYDDGDYSGKTS